LPKLLQPKRYGLCGIAVEKLSLLLDDLRRSLNKRISPKMAFQYQACLDLMAALSLPDGQCEYTTLYYKCLMRTRRQRYARPQMLNLAADER